MLINIIHKESIVPTNLSIEDTTLIDIIKNEYNLVYEKYQSIISRAIKKIILRMVYAWKLMYTVHT